MTRMMKMTMRCMTRQRLMGFTWKPREADRQRIEWRRWKRFPYESKWQIWITTNVEPLKHKYYQEGKNASPPQMRFHYFDFGILNMRFRKFILQMHNNLWVALVSAFENMFPIQQTHYALTRTLQWFLENSFRYFRTNRSIFWIIIKDSKERM